MTTQTTQKPIPYDLGDDDFLNTIISGIEELRGEEIEKWSKLKRPPDLSENKPIKEDEFDEPSEFDKPAWYEEIADEAMRRLQQHHKWFDYELSGMGPGNGKTYMDMAIMHKTDTPSPEYTFKVHFNKSGGVTKIEPMGELDIHDLRENFDGDYLERGLFYSIRDLGGVHGKGGEVREDFEYVGFDRNELEHIFISSDAGGDTFFRIPDEDVNNMVIEPLQGTMVDPGDHEGIPFTEDKDWIQKAIKRPGALHKKLGVPKGKKIPKGKINKAISSLKKKDKDDKEKGTQLPAGDERELRQLNLAKTLSKFNERKLAKRVFEKLRK